jgi:2'-5' RNA ligase
MSERTPVRPTGKPLRLFVAVDIPNDVREALNRLQSDLKRLDLSRLRWVRPEGVHLTLKFLGNTPGEKVRGIEEALATAARGTSPLRLALGKTGTFGGRRRPRVLWLDITGDVQRLGALQLAVDSALADAGFPPEDRKFSPHLTLARVPQPAPAGVAESISHALEAITPPRREFEVSEVLLMQSTLQPGGAVYKRLAALPLR